MSIINISHYDKMIFNVYSIVTSLYENINIGYSLNMYVSKKNIVSDFIVGDFRQIAQFISN